jgi:selenide,water dikinase
MRDPRLLVGAATADDAGVYRLDTDRALVLTVDFFTPVVDGAYDYGQIAAANSLSDVYAMGGRPLTALNILGVPEEKLPPDAVNRILRGGTAKAREARCLIVGGHTIKNPEPIYGLSVTGLVHPRRMITNAAARPGDWLVLTKPLGTGIVTTAIKRRLCPPSLARRAVKVMRHLNRIGADLAERRLVKAGTDITGFGLLGHLASLCRASRVSAEIATDRVPALGSTVWRLIELGCLPGGTRQNLEAAAANTAFAADVTEAQRLLLADAQTSGGLLLCVRPRHLAIVEQRLAQVGSPSAAIIGRISRRRSHLISVRRAPVAS